MTKFVSVMLVLVIAAAAGGAGWWYADQTNQAVRASSLQRIAAQETLMKDMVQMVQRSDGDPAVLRALPSCSSNEQSTYESLLGGLDKDLSADQLQTLTELFNKCGDYDALQRSVMVSRLDQEVRHYRQLVEIAGELQVVDDSVAAKLKNWEDIIDVETRQRDYFFQLVRLQGDIIAAIRNGSSRESDEIVGLLNRVNQIRGQMDVLRTESRPMYGGI